ncbi:ABC transporter ATP-binding protein [[Mycoplasma] gypis]|uniref:ABC transporter ATP-binding protein n=1 Tax=[Mycoplasma] gypis TaxID=92404 RepID=A0ABZ2RTK0_9BACT|nr:ABC transporter ATP-binding protein [[Mycoplasma] gypis]MBN0919581.1 ABC transporter ATP-binding protein [[Mycoplasma] gypis]
MKKFYTETHRKWLFKKEDHIRFDVDGLDAMLENNENKELLATLRHVDITYGSGSKAFKAVKDLNLNIYKGEVLGLVGESGSGKSTIGKAVVGLIPHSFGEIKLLDKTLPKKMTRGFKVGKALKEYKEIEKFMVNKVQMIFQDPANSLNPHVNVEEVVSEGLNNTKNSKIIYQNAVDSETLAVVFEKINNTKKYDKELLAKLNKDIKLPPEEAFQILYEDFAKQLLADNEQEALEALKTRKNERLEADKKTEKEAKKILVKEILKSVGLDESVLRRYPLEFSGGQQQRIGISRSVVLRPTLLVADEPISALDVSIQAQVVNIFNDLKEKYDLTILFIAHDLRMVEYISDRIVVMNKGVLLEIGKTEEIMNNSKHPYTRSLLEAVPSIDSKQGSLIGYVYDSNMHDYSETNQPEWIKVNDNHFVLATKEEFQRWNKGEK